MEAAKKIGEIARISIFSQPQRADFSFVPRAKLPKARLQQNRSNFYLTKELQEVCTDGTFQLDPKQITNKQFTECFEESAWAHRVLKSRDDRLIGLFADLLISIQEQKRWCWPDVDAGGKNGKGEIYPSIAGRLADRLIEHSKLKDIADTLSDVANPHIDA